jgi:hypothetical protein
MEPLIQKENREGIGQSIPVNGEPASKTHARKAPLALADPLQLYLFEIGRYGLLRKDEEKDSPLWSERKMIKKRLIN